MRNEYCEVHPPPGAGRFCPIRHPLSRLKTTTKPKKENQNQNQNQNQKKTQAYDDPLLLKLLYPSYGDGANMVDSFGCAISPSPCTEPFHLPHFQLIDFQLTNTVVSLSKVLFLPSSPGPLGRGGVPLRCLV